MTRPARLRSAALRGPTPFRNWRGVESVSVEPCPLLNDDGLALPDFDLLDLRRQLERVVEAHALRVVGGPASSRPRCPAAPRAEPERPTPSASSSSNRPMPFCVRSTPLTVTGKRPPRYDQGSRVRPVERRLAITSRSTVAAPFSLPLPTMVTLRIADAGGQHVAAAIREPGIDFGFGERRALRGPRDRPRIAADVPCCVTIAIFLVNASACCSETAAAWRAPSPTTREKQKTPMLRREDIERPPGAGWTRV